MLFHAMVEFCLDLLRSKFWLIGEWSIVGKCRAKIYASSTKWVNRIFNEWQLARTNKEVMRIVRYENCSLMFDLDKVQRLD